MEKRLFAGGFTRAINNVLAVTCLLTMMGCCAHIWNSSGEATSNIVGAWIMKNHPDRSILLVFNRDFTYHVDFTRDGQADIWGQYEILRDRIRMDDEEALIYTECYTPGYYRHHISKEYLEFTLIADQCIPRQAALNHLWIKLPHKL